ncbi:BrxE family protein [Rhizobium leguminosarum]|uniref:BrxE family protein n=1 Tax=Rhizobium leguminosarum TaxID=384 RepID=A0A4V2IJS4_RHILE|nr:BrxE family protein [Rhizobium leguminosarum]
MSDLLKVRLLVGYLGEIDQFGWWKTSFYQPASQAFLAPIFPRTGHVAKYHGVAEAARLVHDESLSVGSYHLFRLPEELEHDLHTAIAGTEDRTSQDASMHGKDGALEILRAIGEAFISPADGPISLGEIKELRTSHAIAQMAGIYAAAFQRGIKAFPYLSRA